MKKIVLDAGHGGTDPGATGNGLKEKDIVLQIATLAAMQLEQLYSDADVLMTRTSDVFVELPDRADAANRFGADLLVSIHVNAAGGGGGFESYAHTNASSAAVSLQNMVHREVWKRISALGVTNDRGQKRANYAVLRETKMPAVLIECLFIDVAQDAAKLRQATVINAFVDGIVAGIAAFIGLTKRQPVAPAEVTSVVNGAVVPGGIIKDGVTYVPLRAIGEALGATVTWDNKTKTATLQVPEK